MRTIIENDRVIDEIPTIQTLGLLGDHATAYIEEAKTTKVPFLMYLAHNYPHSTVVPSDKWKGNNGW